MTNIAIERLLHNFPTLVELIQDYIDDFNVKDFLGVPVSLQFKLYEAYVHDNPDDFLGELFYNIENEDREQFFRFLHHPTKSIQFELRGLVMKYIYKNHQLFFNDIFTYLKDQKDTKLQNFSKVRKQGIRL